MTEVIPAILVNNYKELKDKIRKFVGISNIVQIDVCDGSFVPSVSWPLNEEGENDTLPIIEEEEGLPFWDELNFEFDLMIDKSYEYFDFFAKLGAKRIVFHIKENEIENLRDFIEGIDEFSRENIEIGVAVGENLKINQVRSLINTIDFIQCMGIKKIGYQGEKFEEETLETIKELKKLYPEITISVDGGVNEESAPLLVEAGADRLVIGSALDKTSNPEFKIKEFRKLEPKNG